jgi:hypothetical protein
MLAGGATNANDALVSIGRFSVGEWPSNMVVFNHAFATELHYSIAGYRASERLSC